MKILVNALTGLQELIEILEGGGYFDADCVIWDERIDGPLPEITLGGMVREGDALVLDTEKLAAYEAIIAATAAAARGAANATVRMQMRVNALLNKGQIARAIKVKGGL